MRFLFLKFFLAEGSLPQVVCRLDEVKAERSSLVRRAGFGWSDCPNDAVPQADRERVVGGALIQEELAWLHDESFDLDLIGYATELERLLGARRRRGWVRRRRGRLVIPRLRRNAEPTGDDDKRCYDEGVLGRPSQISSSVPKERPRMADPAVIRRVMRVDENTVANTAQRRSCACEHVHLAAGPDSSRRACRAGQAG